MDRETIVRMAGIARIDLTADDTELFRKETDLLFDMLKVLDEVPGCDSFCFDPVGVSDALREDIPIVDDNVEEMLKSMDTYDGFVRGPKI